MSDSDTNVEQLEAKRPKVGFYLLPNLFTTGSLFAGFYAIMQSRSGFFEAACIAIFIAMVLDTLDGRLARLTNTTSEFGSHYDSLVDLVSFGVAPALVMYEWSLNGLGKIGSLAAFIYMATCALRLARFNVQNSVESKNFIGLPSPCAAGLIASTVWMGIDNSIGVAQWNVAICILTVLTGMAMVSNFSYWSFKHLDLKDRVPFVALIVLVLVIGLISVDPPIVFFAVGFTYLLSGPLGSMYERYRNRDESSV
jgi:CDP-diacylglycerol--serine O-phosphatidyltransferase